MTENKDNRARLADEQFMRQALIEAEKASEAGEVPIGAVVVVGGKIIARAHNLTILPTAPSMSPLSRARCVQVRSDGHRRVA